MVQLDERVSVTSGAEIFADFGDHCGQVDNSTMPWTITRWDGGTGPEPKAGMVVRSWNRDDMQASGASTFGGGHGVQEFELDAPVKVHRTFDTQSTLFEFKLGGGGITINGTLIPNGGEWGGDFSYSAMDSKGSPRMAHEQVVLRVLGSIPVRVEHTSLCI